MTCKSCGSKRIVNVSGKTSDMCFVSIDEDKFEHDGYVPDGFGLGNGDYIEITYCANCGQMFSKDFPIKIQTK